jgi:hypothetical protein
LLCLITGQSKHMDQLINFRRIHDGCPRKRWHNRQPYLSPLHRYHYRRRSFLRTTDGDPARNLRTCGRRRFIRRVMRPTLFCGAVSHRPYSCRQRLEQPRDQSARSAYSPRQQPARLLVLNGRHPGPGNTRLAEAGEASRDARQLSAQPGPGALGRS